MPGYRPRNGATRGSHYGSSFGSRFQDVNHHYNENPEWNESNCPPFEKCFYIEHEETKKMSESEIDAFRKEHAMTLTGTDIPRPLMKFSHTQWPKPITKLFESQGFDKPTAIQSQGWPMALTGRNVIGIAQTGSGKTLSFVLPALMHILGQPPLVRGDGPIALILAPTRELACQIQTVVKEYGSVLDVRNACLYGGASKGPQIGELNRSPHIIIATPGRLIDLLQMGKTTLNKVSYLVLDEADRMLDMGFEPDLRKIMKQIRPDRQLLLWSATWPKAVQRLARDYLTDDHIKVQIGSTKLQANKRINQIVKVVPEQEKMAELCKLLIQIWDNIEGSNESKRMERTIIFANKKYLCEEILKVLWDEEWNAVTIHGDKTQQERDRALYDFKSGHSPILIATDVAARGLDVTDLMHVINFDFPNNVEDFIHRIGRTARGNAATGNSYTFFTNQKSDRSNAGALVDLMKDAEQDVPAELLNLVQYSRRPGSNNNRYGGSRGRGNSRGGRGNFSRNNNGYGRW